MIGPPPHKIFSPMIGPRLISYSQHTVHITHLVIFIPHQKTYERYAPENIAKDLIKKKQPPPHNHKSTTKTLLILISLELNSFNKSFLNKAFQFSSFKYCIMTPVYSNGMSLRRTKVNIQCCLRKISRFYGKSFFLREAYILYIYKIHINCIQP